MTAENEKPVGGRDRRPIILCPWLVALAALALYGLTLNHWVTFSSIPFVAPITGWNWHPGPLLWRQTPQYPLLFLLTFPLRLLPAGWRVIGLNVFSAVCAALTLAILARSVRLLPHDRTKEQRIREGGEFALLSVRTAFLPAGFAVLLLAGQMTFWENAVAGTGEMLDLLVFAFLILCLLEFRISQNETWLSVFALVYGMGVTNDWALIGFFPCFLLALIWIKRMGFFNIRFAARMTGWGTLGLLLYGLIPLLGAAAKDAGFWALLHQKLAEQHIYLTGIRRYYPAIAMVPTLIPLLFAAIYWPSSEGELSPGAHDLTRVLFRVLHLVFLVVGVLMFCNVKFSPRNMGIGVMGPPGFLTFYYLAALSVGYFSGYVLLVFGHGMIHGWDEAKGIARVLNGVVTGLLWVAAIGLPAMLFWQHFPRIQASNGPAVEQFGMEMAKALPSGPAIVLADDPARLYLAMGACQGLGLADRYVFVESRALIYRKYLHYLAARYPSFGNEVTNLDRQPEMITSQQVGDLLSHLARRHPVYYLNPSFGSYFERVCMTPYRLGGYLHPCPNSVLETAGLTAAEIATNQAYWHALKGQTLDSLADLAKLGLDGLPEKSADAVRIASYYSQMLDYWGTELQKAGTELKLPLLLKDAGDQFAEAIRLNPENLIAQVNQQFNAHLRGVPSGGDLINSSVLADNFSGSWDVVYNVYGPPDVPDLDLQVGRFFAQRHAYLQAAHLFQRCLELAPNNPVAELDAAKTYIDMGLVDAGLSVLRGIREPFAGNDLDLARVEALAYAKKNDFAQADRVLMEGHSRHPRDETFPGVMAEFYRRIGYSVLNESNGDPAKEKEAPKWFQKSLAALDEQLALINAPVNGTARLQEIPALNFEKAEMQMMLKDYPAAIVTLTAILRLNPENPRALLDRAISELQASQLDAAKNDFGACEKMFAEPSPIVSYGLAQIAQKRNDKATAIKYDKLYLKYAPHNTAEFTNVTQQLQQLQKVEAR